MHLIGFIVFGFFVGLIARALLPGDQKMGFLKTSLLGIGGSFVGGFLGDLLRGTSAHGGTAGWIGSVFGAVVLFSLARWFGKKGKDD